MTIDLEVVKNIIVGLSTLITSLGIIYAFLKKIKNKIINPILEEVKKMNEPILEKLDRLQEDHCKDHILNCLNDIENGIHKNQYDLARLDEVYKHYTEDLGLNSYVHRRWEEVMGKEEK